MSVEPSRVLTRRGARAAVVAVVATLTLAGSQALMPAPASAQARKPVVVGALPSEAPKRALPELVPVGSTAPVPTRPDVPPHPDAAGDRRRAPAAGAGHDPARSTTIDAETTPTKRVTANPDGSKTLFESAAPVRFQDPAGAWRDIDTALVAAPDGSLGAKASPLAARLGAGATGDIATLETSAGPIILRHPDATPSRAAIRTDGLKSEALYARSLPGGRDVVMSLTGSAIKENVVLADAKAPSTYIDELVLPAGVTARSAAAGIELLDAKGAVVATFTGGLAHDASFPGAGPAAATPVTLRLLASSPAASPPSTTPTTAAPSTTSTSSTSATSVPSSTSTTTSTSPPAAGGNARPAAANVVAVEVGIDAAWLAGPRRFPVTIDPTLPPTPRPPRAARTPSWPTRAGPPPTSPPGPPSTPAPTTPASPPSAAC